MKNFLLGASVFALLSFTAVKTEILTVKPATPKSTVVFSITYDHLGGCVDKIRSYVKKGYIVKTIGGASQYGYSIVVMEKY